MSIEAATRLHKDGVSAEVINAASIKPLDEDTLVRAATRTRHVVTIEDHSIFGGLGGAVAETLAELAPRRVLRVGVPDTFSKAVGGHEFLLRHHGVHTEAVVECVLGGLRRDDHHDRRRTERDLDLPRVRP